MTESRSWESFSEQEQSTMIRETRSYLYHVVQRFNLAPYAALGAHIESTDPKLAAILKEAGAFGDRMALLLRELDSSTEVRDELDEYMRKYTMKLSFSVFHGTYVASGLDHLHGFVWVEHWDLTPLAAVRGVVAQIEGS